ncbi:hypothetical protein LY76DRAFT_274947 [Colletotrichum caudatum]|nr:hypothetical protein LY76DRAFT_274947 [Colletotrichum caudatum]
MRKRPSEPCRLRSTYLHYTTLHYGYTTLPPYGSCPGVLSSTSLVICSLLHLQRTDDPGHPSSFYFYFLFSPFTANTSATLPSIAPP